MKKKRVFIIILFFIVLMSSTVYASDDRSARSPRVVPPIILKKGVYISSKYGYRVHPITKKWTMHRGIDIVAPIGTHIYAISSGEVIMARKNGSAGNEIRIKHGNGIESRYLHMYQRTVNVGDKVKTGQLIGTVGDTGRVTGPHLHLELKVRGKTVNPVKIMTGKK